MSPRAYRLGQRQGAVEQTRARIVEAARALLAAEGGVSGFSVEAVARQASVARMTVYYQFGSKRGLLEALFDDLAARGGMAAIASVYHEPEPRVALGALVAVFARFWATDRLIMRRVRSMAALDPELGQAVHTRDEWRRGHGRVLAERLAERYGHPTPAEMDGAVDLLFTLLSFETFDMLAGARPIEDVAPAVEHLAALALGLPTE